MMSTELKRVVTLMIVLATVGITVIPAPVAAQVSDDEPAEPVSIQVSDISVSDRTPTAGDTVVLDITIEASGIDGNSINITKLSLHTSEGKISTVETIGSLTPGDEVTIEQQVSFSEPGIKEIRVNARGTYNNQSGGQTAGNVKIIDVQGSGISRQPQLDVDLGYPDTGAGGEQIVATGNPVANTESNVSVTIANPDNQTIKNLDLRVSSPDLTIETQREVIPEVGGAETVTHTFQPVFTKSGNTDIVARLSYEDGRIEDSESIRVAELETNVSVYTEVQDGQLRTTVANLGNVPIKNVVVEGDGSSRPVQPASFERIEAGNTKVANSSLLGESNFTLSVQYDAGFTNTVNSKTVDVNISERTPNQSVVNTNTTGPADDSESNMPLGSTFSVVMIGLASGLMIGVSISYFVYIG